MNDNPEQASTRLEQFVALSSVLTGFDENLIAPPLDPTDPPLKAVYLATADKHSQGTVDALLAAFQKLQGQPVQQIADTLLEAGSTSPPSATALMARSIAKMWYLGSWYPTDNSETAFNGSVVSMNGYIGGLAWTAAQAHPMGYSELKFGYWKAAPPPLTGVRNPQEKSNG